MKSHRFKKSRNDQSKKRKIEERKLALTEKDSSSSPKTTTVSANQTAAQALALKKATQSENSMAAATNDGLRKATEGAGSWRNDPAVLKKLTEMGLRTQR